MQKVPEIRRHNLKLLSEKFESQRAFADALDVTPGYASQLLLGACKFGEKAARKIELQLKKPPLWLDVLHEDNGDYIDSYAVNEKRLPLFGLPDKINKPEVVMIPLIAFDRAGKWQDALKDHHQDDGEIMLKPITGKDLFIVPVPDDSMEPEFMGTGDEGVVIDPHMEAQHKRFVLVQIGDSVTLRQLWNDQGEWLLRPLNTNDFKAKPLGNGQIIGVVRRKVKIKETDYC